jgi:hypothetical protein
VDAEYKQGLDRPENREEKAMNRLLRNILGVLGGQYWNGLFGGAESPSAVRKLCLLDESKRLFFVESGEEGKDSGRAPVTTAGDE